MRRAGFTLLELLLVLTVLGILSALGAARLGGMRASQGLEQAARQVQEQAVRAQHLAVARGEAVRLRLDPAAGSAAVQLAAGGDPPDGHPACVQLYEGAEALGLVFTRGDGGAVGSGPVDILFLPDARCDLPGSVALNCAGRDATVRISAGAQPPTVELPR